MRDGKAPQVCRSGEIALSLKGPEMEWIQNFLSCKEERDMDEWGGNARSCGRRRGAGPLI